MLLLLLICQSASSSILQEYQSVIARHIEVTLFLTMAVGAGGNAANQVAVRVIHGLATGELDVARLLPFVRHEVIVGSLTAATLGVAASLRVAFTLSAAPTMLATSKVVGLGVALIVVAAVAVGVVAPLALFAAGRDPAHAVPGVQVIMDVVGVLIICALTQRLD